jgi:hypothetical protein
MSAAAGAAVPTLRVGGPNARYAGGPLVAICGLHGGAGTTSLARLLAEAAQASATAGAVMLCETDPCGGGLAIELGQASPHGLHDVAADRRDARRAPFAQLPDGLRLCAAAPAPRAPADSSQVGATLDDARAAHALTIVDCATLREAHGHVALERADAIVWTLGAHHEPRRALLLLGSALARSALRGRWVIAVSDAGVAGVDNARTAARELTEHLAIDVVLVPNLASCDNDARALAVQQLSQALT